MICEHCGRELIYRIIPNTSPIQKWLVHKDNKLIYCDNPAIVGRIAKVKE